MALFIPMQVPDIGTMLNMLEVGNGGMTRDEYSTHFSMWCMLATPLMAENDLRNMDAETKEILMNKEAIAVNQDALGQQHDASWIWGKRNLGKASGRRRIGCLFLEPNGRCLAFRL